MQNSVTTNDARRQRQTPINTSSNDISGGSAPDSCRAAVATTAKCIRRGPDAVGGDLRTLGVDAVAYSGERTGNGRAVARDGWVSLAEGGLHLWGRAKQYNSFAGILTDGPDIITFSVYCIDI